jgi:hypothetical protein
MVERSLGFKKRGLLLYGIERHARYSGILKRQAETEIGQQFTIVHSSFTIILAS